jgi:hypothetical protein
MWSKKAKDLWSCRDAFDAKFGVFKIEEKGDFEPRDIEVAEHLMAQISQIGMTAMAGLSELSVSSVVFLHQAVSSVSSGMGRFFDHRWHRYHRSKKRYDCIGWAI